MNYQSVNSISDFEFHDSVWAFVSFESSSLTVRVKELNLHKGTPQNPYDCDMEIDTAYIVFERITILSQMPSVPWKTDVSGKSHPVEPIITYTGKAAVDRFMHEIKHGITVYSFVKDDKGQYMISAYGEDPYFEAEFASDSIRIEFDTLQCPAWYVSHR